MGFHPEPVRNRLELLGLLVNAVPAAPPGALMHEGAVRGIHQSHDPVVDRAA